MSAVAGFSMKRPLMRARSPSGPARPAHHLPGPRAGVLAIAQDNDAIDQHIRHPCCVLRRVIEGRVILNRGGIEHHHVPGITDAEPPALMQTQLTTQAAPPADAKQS